MDEPILARLRGPSIPDGALAVYKLDGVEAISSLFEFTVGVASADAGGIDETQLVSEPVQILLEQAGQHVRTVHGIICAVRDVATEPGLHHLSYELTIVPRAWWLTQNVTSEVFVGLSVPRIIATKLDRIGLTEGKDYELRMSGGYAAREFVLQYGESDFSFCSRLASHLGISFFFEHREDRDVIVFTDSNAGFPKDGPIPYRPPEARRGVNRFEGTVRSLPKRVQVRDYNYRTPTVSIDSQASVETGHLGNVAEYGSHAKTVAEASAIARVRAEEIAMGHWQFDAASNVPQVSAGRAFALSGHPKRDGELLPTKVGHRLRQDPFLIASGEPPIYENTFQAIPFTATFRPPRDAVKPRIHGVVTGVIETEGRGEYADVDEQGRYRVRFLFDRSGAGHAKASHPVRMAQPHAGAGYGFHFPLRDGTEVMIAFIDGDPDRPIIAAALPNPVTPSTVTSANERRNVIRTGGGNEINIDDTRGSERIKMSTPYGNTVFQLGAPNVPKAGFVLKTDKDGHLDSDNEIVMQATNKIKAETQLCDIIGDERVRIGGAHVRIFAGSDRIDQTEGEHRILADRVTVVAGRFQVTADELELTAGGSSIIMKEGVVTIIAPNLIELNP